MVNKRYMKMVIALTFVVLPIVATGCTDNNEVRQQGNRTDRIDRIQQQTDTNPADNRILVADQAAQKIVSIPGVKQANVVVTQRNAYVAAVLDDGQSQLSREIEDQIASKVRETDPTIQNVYVSTNPDFIDRINAYVRDVQEGRPVAGFVEEFNEMVQRIFPNAR
ncbi:YhcN/YlaJ family sporulation lipoprotein [Paenibacillus alginolyticus]|uniref:YhcN/YlaJ family sporulation lipoprotein n=2 Tax=Paenibacillus TaxID=44249 RepID=UPI002283FF96|nr:YhcN/YlaJ family sporulation lipoprotein [Paenibacillus alginolyticus]MCY9669571.1 YhcN/YlaJ family sporulation lipoprotein [Paenibacillus alginolyticus]